MNRDHYTKTAYVSKVKGLGLERSPALVEKTAKAIVVPVPTPISMKLPS
jgi:hypothetical protein